MNLAEYPIEVLQEFAEQALQSGDQALLAAYMEALAEYARAWEPQDYQREPDTPWALWLFLAARFTGKTDAGAHAFNEHAEGPACDARVPGGHRMRLIGPTFTDTVASCVNGPTGLKAHNPNVILITTKEGTVVRWPNGTEARIFGAYGPEDPERLRSGGNSSLATGTLIETAGGQRSIEQIRRGDLVWTEAGLRPVLGAWSHGAKPIWTVTTDAGRVLRLTPDHEVWVDGSGWTRCDALVVGGRLIAWNGAVTVGSDSRLATGRGPQGTGRSSSTGPSTNTTSARSLTASTSTTRTASRTTTAPRIWKPSLRKPTTPSILIPLSGMPLAVARADETGASSETARGAGSPRRTNGSAPRHAGERRNGKPLRLPACGHVSCAAAISFAPKVSPPLLAPDRVATILPGNAVERVWDLTVSGEHDFFADGILVANCFDWYEEMAAWRQLEPALDQATFGLRLGDHSRAIATTTPKNRAKVRELRAIGEKFANTPPDERAKLTRDQRVAVSTATTAQNRYGDPEVREGLYAAYAGTRLGAQELEAKILDSLGTFFATAWFQWLDSPTGWPRKVRSWDLAGTPPGPANDDPDWSVGALVAYDPTPRAWTLADGTIIQAGSFAIEHVKRLRDSPAIVEQAVVDMAKQDGPGVKVVIEKEPGQSGKSQLAHFQQALAGITLVEEFSPSGPKNVRAQLVSGPAQQGRVSIMRGPWNQALLDELEEYTGDEKVDKHDDQVDALSQAFAVLEGRGGMASATAPQGSMPSRDALLSGGRGGFAGRRGFPG